MASVCKSKRNKVHVTIKAKGLGQGFEERRRGRPGAMSSTIIQKRPNTVVHLKVRVVVYIMARGKRSMTPSPMHADR